MCKNIVQQDRPQMTNMVHAHCMLDTWGYKHAHITRNIYCFWSATMVAWRGVIVTRTLRVLWITILEICNFQITVRDILLGVSRFGRRRGSGLHSTDTALMGNRVQKFWTYRISSKRREPISTDVASYSRATRSSHNSLFVENKILRVN